MGKMILKLLEQEAIVLFFIISIVILLMLVFIGIYSSRIEIQLENIDISTLRKEKISKNYEIIVGIVLFNRWKIIKIRIDKKKIKHIGKNKIIKKLDTRILKSNGKTKNVIEIIKDLKIEIMKLQMNLEIGIEDAGVTAITVGIIASILGIILKNKLTNKDRFEVTPIYMQKNLINLRLNCIFRINLIHYIYKKIFKERRKKDERKPSYRRTYAYSHE